MKTEGIGTKSLQSILNLYKDPAEVFQLNTKSLKNIPCIGPSIIKNILSKKGLDAAEKEMLFINQFKIQASCDTDASYPERLKDCQDRPKIIYYKGNAPLESSKMLSIVGTRHASKYSDLFLEKFFEEISEIEGITIVSGLAMGVDIKAHKLALKYKIPTIGVMGTGMQKIYPDKHREYATKMIECGGLLTEFHSDDMIAPGNFPRRNRIIAGLSDAVLVVETNIKGGSVITANIAHSYNREVFAVPGRTIDVFSTGCNFLIKTFKATMVTKAADILDSMNWNKSKHISKGLVQSLHFEQDDDAMIYQTIKQNPDIHIDELVALTGITNSLLASILLKLELEGYLQTLPGKRYKVVT